MLDDGNQGGGMTIMISASATFTSQAAYAAIDDGEVKVFKHPSGKNFYVMDSIEVEQTRKSKQKIGVSQQGIANKVNGGWVQKMIEDNARRKHSGILG
jgi:hypothetical protein